MAMPGGRCPGGDARGAMDQSKNVGGKRIMSGHAITHSDKYVMLCKHRLGIMIHVVFQAPTIRYDYGILHKTDIVYDINLLFAFQFIARYYM